MLSRTVSGVLLITLCLVRGLCFFDRPLPRPPWVLRQVSFRLGLCPSPSPSTSFFYCRVFVCLFFCSYTISRACPCLSTFVSAVQSLSPSPLSLFLPLCLCLYLPLCLCLPLSLSLFVSVPLYPRLPLCLPMSLCLSVSFSRLSPSPSPPPSSSLSLSLSISLSLPLSLSPSLSLPLSAS